MKKNYNIALFILIIFSIFFSFLSFRSSVAQKKIMLDLDKDIPTFNFEDIDNMLSGYPNITSAAQPFDIYKVQYLFMERKFSLARKYIQSASKANPHIYISDYLTGLFYYKQQIFDSAFYYSKKAFEGWPKHIPHYNLYVDVLETKRDTTSLINAFDYLNIDLKRKPDYYKKFYDSFNKIKLSFLITRFPDSRDLMYSDLTNFKFERGYNFPNNQVIRDTTISYRFISHNIFQNSKGSEYSYSINKDTLYFFYKNNLNKAFQKFQAQFSPQYNTLIFKNVKIEDGKYQDQFFIKSQ